MKTLKEIKKLIGVVNCHNDRFIFHFDKIEGGQGLFIWNSLKDPPVEFHGDELDIVVTKEDAEALYDKFLKMKGYRQNG